ncbi:hypothetical protein QTP88_013608 [Uroleucon formosanum]
MGHPGRPPNGYRYRPNHRQPKPDLHPHRLDAVPGLSAQTGTSKEHFSPDYFLNYKNNKLKSNAIPHKYNSNETPSTSSGTVDKDEDNNIDKPLTPTKTYETSRSEMTELIFPSPSSITDAPKKIIKDLIHMPTPNSKRLIYADEDDTPRKKKLKLKIDQQKIKLRNKNVQVCKLKKRVTRFKTRNTLRSLMYSHRFTSKNARAIVTMQLRNERIPWTLEEKNLALTLFYKSPTAYNFLRLQNINLPAPSTIRPWIGESKFLPGLSFEDFGHYGRTNKSANCVMVFMARGLFSPWKFPVAYFLALSGVKHKLLKDLIIDVLTELIKNGLCSKVLVCDQGTNNQSALKSLGVDENKPYFFVENNKIFSIFDVPHLIKSVRNNLIGCSFEKNNMKIAAFSDIVATYEIDKKNIKSKSLLKITEAHINPSSFQKMRVKLAVQLFSHTMASTIRTCIETNELKSNTAKNTANCVDFINKLFDCLNSKTLYTSNPYNCGLSDSGVVKPFLNEAATYFINLQKNKKGKMTKSPCFKGITQTINGILSFFEDEKSNNNEVSFILTNRLNQDTLENLFSIMRQKGGYNKNPTARTIRTSFRSTCIFSLCTSKGANCENIIENTDYQTNEQVSILLEGEQINNIENDQSSDTNSECSVNYIDVLVPEDLNSISVTLGDCSVTYFAGYLAFICIKKFSCENCKSDLIMEKDLNEKNQILIIKKNYSLFDTGLMAPTKIFNYIIDNILNIFENNFDNVKHKKKIRYNLMNKIQSNEKIKAWIEMNADCVEHKLYIKEHLLICNIFKKTKLYATTSKLAKIEKLKILSHI